jgi:hypothetical protein
MSVENITAPKVASPAEPPPANSGRAFIRRREAAEYLASIGLPIAFNTLQKLATTGGGPVFRKFGRWPVYRREDLEAWARSRLSKPKASTSQAA